MHTEPSPLKDFTPLALRGRSRLVSSAVLTGGSHTPVVFCCVLIYAPEPTVRRLRVLDDRRRARVARAPKAANDEARIFAEAGHPLYFMMVVDWRSTCRIIMRDHGGGARQSRSI